ncbi:MAG: nucleotidyltransferase domain-containing protein [Planctomycetes bacterium]|nr:nucleotidyltransferase domain-containing protein [Planctomycetota bacterium]
MLDGLFTSKLKRDVLSAIILQPDKQFYTRELARHLKVSEGSLHRELTVLVQAGIINRTEEGNRVYYQAQTESPIYRDLYNLLLKTVGLVEVIAKALQPLSTLISAAFIYGSIAEETATTESDVDLMIIGSARLSQVVDAIGAVQKTLGREVNPTVYPIAEWQDKLAGKHHFVTTVLKSKKIFLVGSEDELAKIAE